MSVHSQAEVTFITYCVILYNHQSGIGEGLSTLQSIYLIFRYKYFFWLCGNGAVCA